MLATAPSVMYETPEFDDGRRRFIVRTVQADKGLEHEVLLTGYSAISHSRIESRIRELLVNGPIPVFRAPVANSMSPEFHHAVFVGSVKASPWNYVKEFEKEIRDYLNISSKYE